MTIRHAIGHGSAPWDLPEAGTDVPTGLVSAGAQIQTVTGTTVGGTPAGLTFAMEWNTALGQSNAAILDTGRSQPLTFHSPIGNTGFEVLSTAAEGRGYPTANFLRVLNESFPIAGFNSDAGYQMQRPAIGSYFFFRHYFNLIQTGTASDSHGTYFDDLEALPNWGPPVTGYYIPSVQTSTYNFFTAVGDDQFPNSWTYFYPGFVFNKNTIYRHELRVEIVAANQYSLDSRVYDVNDVLLADVGDFVEPPGWGSGRAMSGQVFTTTAARMLSFAGLRIGVEASQGPGNYCEYAALAAGESSNADDWLGPYQASEASFNP